MPEPTSQATDIVKSKSTSSSEVVTVCIFVNLISPEIELNGLLSKPLPTGSDSGDDSPSSESDPDTDSSAPYLEDAGRRR